MTRSIPTPVRKAGDSVSLFKKRPKSPSVSWNPDTQQPAVRKSICTGEMTVGFIDKATGRFTDLMRVDDMRGLEAFMESIGAKEYKTIY